MKKVLLLVACMMFVGISQAQAQVLLGSISNITSSGGSRGIRTSIDLDVGYRVDTDGLLHTLFDDVFAVNGDAGLLYTATSVSEPNFAAFTALLTDGIDQRIGYNTSTGGTDRFESFFFGAGSSLNGIDFQGFSISRYELFIDQASIESPGSDPNADGNWTDYDVSATFRIFGEQNSANVVPEPATMILFGTGIAGAFARRRKQLG